MGAEMGDEVNERLNRVACDLRGVEGEEGDGVATPLTARAGAPSGKRCVLD
jgi:hypothetical protein